MIRGQPVRHQIAFAIGLVIAAVLWVTLGTEAIAMAQGPHRTPFSLVPAALVTVQVGAVVASVIGSHRHPERGLALPGVLVGASILLCFGYLTAFPLL